MKYEIRDPIHKRITFNTFERRIIDHPTFQRLRFISQLGFTQAYVYPGAVHDRFQHGLGAMHVAGRLFNRCVGSTNVFRDHLGKDEIKALESRVRMAGLLHDIGHGPFSHASEIIFPAIETLPLDWSWWKSKPSRRQATHEDYSVLLIESLAREGVLDREFARDICSLIHGEIIPSSFLFSLVDKIPSLQFVLKGLISGEIDCDRMDYLLRDSYYCGVAYGHYDLDWLISSIGVAQHEDKLIFTISENGVRAFEDVLLARYHMIDQVYFHKTKAGFTHYLEQAIKTGEVDLVIPSDPKEYVQLRDGAVIERLFKAAKDESNYYSHHLMRRIPAKRMLRLHDEKPEDRESLRILQQRCEQRGVRFFTHSAKNRFSFFSGHETDQTAMIYVRKNTVDGIVYVPVFDYSDLLQKYNEKMAFTDFFILREDVEKYGRID